MKMIRPDGKLYQGSCRSEAQKRGNIFCEIIIYFAEASCGAGSVIGTCGASNFG